MQSPHLLFPFRLFDSNLHLKDTTTHPYWTGKTSTLEEGQEGSLARFRKRFGNLGVSFGEEEAEDPDDAATASR